MLNCNLSQYQQIVLFSLAAVSFHSIMIFFFHFCTEKLNIMEKEALMTSLIYQYASDPLLDPSQQSLTRAELRGVKEHVWAPKFPSVCQPPAEGDVNREFP